MHWPLTMFLRPCYERYVHSEANVKNPLQGITLKMIVEDLVERRGFENLGSIVKIRCFNYDPSVASALKFLRRTEWARKEVENLYLSDHYPR